MIQAAEATHVANLAIADVEAAFLEGKPQTSVTVRTNFYISDVCQQSRVCGTHISFLKT